MKAPSVSVQRQQTKVQFANAQDYLNYELGHAQRRLPPVYIRLLGFSICALVGGTIAWATFSKVDEVATAPGQVIPASQVQPMRSLASGLLREIKVTEGKHVQKGDVLVQLDPTISQSEVDRLEKLSQQNRDTLARLQAERNGNTQAGSFLQNQLLAARLREFRDRRAAAEAEANRQLSLIKTAQVQKTRLEADLTHASTKTQAYRSLQQEGAVPRFDYLDSQNKVDSLQKEIALQEQAIEQAKQAHQAAMKNATRLESERQSEILTQIDKQQQELTDLNAKLTQAQAQHKHSTIRAGVTGTVYNIKVSKTGSTVQPGDEVLSIVPDSEELILEAKVQNQDVGFVRSGMRVKVKLATFPYQEFGMIEGIISRVSPNAVNEQNGGSVFPIQVRLKQRSVKANDREVLLSPGMAATAEIVTRQKTVMSFLLDPITASWDRAFSVR
ncbi:MAG TPA: HlyD family type I secretion periplasmic adaptor subunit [Leptolyngbyaceae cyanobacterium M33_DOE_097]|uniref:HlyD family type I secretion periplasmic adaptor subunit n=1 Tax=Oscillatoriales cyanobacterium SpSt-418 TaxID=2282169 RepID=A0A7C3PCR0_9CYAN|nr:HlyD family type I secretion periplasmic adaptor subunit [Leptolyngbyaceae cyanobacterium M33_DOE_097]